MESNFSVELLMFFLHYTSMVVDILTFPIYYLMQKSNQAKTPCGHKKAYQVIDFNGKLRITSTESYGSIHKELDGQKITNMSQLLNFFTEKFKHKQCLGSRPLLEENENDQNGKRLIKCKYGEYAWKTYSQVNKLAANFGQGIRELLINQKSYVAIFAETREEWLIAAHGLFKQNIPLVTVYATLGPDGIEHALSETKPEIVITTYELLGKLKKVLKELHSINVLVYIKHPLEKSKPSGFDRRLVTFDYVLKIGAISKLSSTAHFRIEPAVIMYTSGSTGKPKGVIIKHSNIIAAIKGYCDRTDTFNLGQKDIYIAFLPLAHIFELIVENVCISIGIAIGYSSAHTLTDTSEKIMKGTKGDATLLQPTVMSAVPLILDRLRQGIMDKLREASTMNRTFFQFACIYKAYWYNYGYNTFLIDSLIFKKCRSFIGGNLKTIMCGGSALTPELQEFISLVLCVNLGQGYGLTETTSCTTVMDGFDRSYGNVGAVSTACELMIEDWDEANYHINDQPLPRGEIIVGGDAVTGGYWNKPDITFDNYFEYDEIRWVRTGDICVVNIDGTIKIVDRKKDIVKLAHGEYLSLGKVEMVLREFPLVDMVCVFPCVSKRFCIALISPNVAKLDKFANEMDIIDLEFKDQCETNDIITKIHQEIIDHCKNYNLRQEETPKYIMLCSEPWTPENGLVTAALKTRRKEIEKKYQSEISKLCKADETSE